MSNNKVFCLTNNKLYLTASEAARDLGIPATSVIAVCKKKRSHAKGIVCCYEKDIQTFTPLVVADKKKPVYCIELNKTFGSITEAANFLNLSVSNISAVLSNKKPTCGGYTWCYASDKGTPNVRQNKRKKPVLCLDNGKTYESATQAAKMVGGTARSISAAASGIIKKTAGRSWCYLDELESLDVSTRIPYTGKSVYCLELDKVFNTIKEAADELGLLERNIGQVCQGIHRTAGQMRFCYASEKDNINWEDKPIHISSGQLLMQTILTSMGVKFEVNNRSTLKNKRELDILIPEHKIAIEYNGVYWHQESTVGKDYHLMKTNEANELGLELIHVFEHQLTENNLSLWGSVIKNKCGLSGKGIMARKTKVVNISDKECKSFLDKNHLQGNSGSLVKLGLMYKDELVAVMTFGSPRFDKKYQWELIRFCCKQNTTVIGGASKLLKHFETQYAPKNLISYANLQWSNGNLYKNLGFKESHRSSPSYWWCKEKVAHTRHKCQKHKLATWLPNFNTEQTESENMKKNGYYKVYDCGNIVFTKSY